MKVSVWMVMLLGCCLCPVHSGTKSPKGELYCAREYSQVKDVNMAPADYAKTARETLTWNMERTGRLGEKGHNININVAIGVSPKRINHRSQVSCDPPCFATKMAVDWSKGQPDSTQGEVCLSSPDFQWSPICIHPMDFELGGRDKGTLSLMVLGYLKTQKYAPFFDSLFRCAGKTIHEAILIDSSCIVRDGVNRGSFRIIIATTNPDWFVAQYDDRARWFKWGLIQKIPEKSETWLAVINNPGDGHEIKGDFYVHHHNRNRFSWDSNVKDTIHVMELSNGVASTPEGMHYKTYRRSSECNSGYKPRVKKLPYNIEKDILAGGDIWLQAKASGVANDTTSVVKQQIAEVKQQMQQLRGEVVKEVQSILTKMIAQEVAKASSREIRRQVATLKSSILPNVELTINKLIRSQIEIQLKDWFLNT